jgi:hypothetical protein
MRSVDNIRIMFCHGWQLSPGEQERLLNIAELAWALRGRMTQDERELRIECLLAACRGFEEMYGVAARDAVPVPVNEPMDMLSTVRKDAKLWR